MYEHMEFAKPNHVRKGMTPQESYWLEKIESEIERDKRNQRISGGCGLGFLNFVEQMKKICKLGSETKANIPCSYLFPREDPKAVAQIEKVEWGGVPKSCGSLLYLTKLFVLDTERDNGIGTNFVQEIKRTVDETGMVLFLRAESFSFSNEEGGLPYSFYNMDDLLQSWEAEKLTSNDGDMVLIEWYKRLGFLNACTHDGDIWPVKEYHRLNKQFLYVGAKNPDQDLYLNRTNESGMCQFCKDQIDAR